MHLNGLSPFVKKKLKKRLLPRDYLLIEYMKKNDHEKNICVLIYRKPNNKLI